MSVNQLQQRLQSIYEIETEHSVSNFMINNDTCKHYFDTETSRIKETVFVRETDDCLDISVYLDEEILDHLTDENPAVSLHQGNLEDFFLATEGVSHFLKLVWHGEYERSVSLLELELQAEIDKFVLMYFYFNDQLTLFNTREVRKLLFEKIEIKQDLDDAQRMRYQDANYFAGKYCQALERNYLDRESGDLLLQELRRFYRLPFSGKLRRINKLN